MASSIDPCASRACAGLIALVSFGGCVSVAENDPNASHVPPADAPTSSVAPAPVMTLAPTLSLTPPPTPTTQPTSTPTTAPTATPSPTKTPASTPTPTPERTPTPPLAAARMAGSFDVTIKVKKKPAGAALKKGETWTDSWDFTPECETGACRVVVDGGIGPSGYTYRSFTVTLSRNGAVYTGSAKAKITTCGGDLVNNKVGLTLEVAEAATYGGEWFASQWAGTMVLQAPYTKTGRLTYCPAQKWTMSLTASD